MSIFPDCRNDSVYNQEFLERDDDIFLQGFDYAVDQIILLLADNLDVYENELTELCPEDHEIEEDEAFTTREDLYPIVQENKDILCAIIKDWLEQARNEAITSMIDAIPQEKFDKIKKEVLELYPDLKTELYDTRKFLVTGKKEFIENDSNTEN